MVARPGRRRDVVDARNDPGVLPRATPVEHAHRDDGRFTLTVKAHPDGFVSRFCDQYSLACTLYEMLVGQPPFTGQSAQAVMARHSLEPVPGVRVVRQTVPPHVEAAVLRAMAKAPADRFATASHLAAALQAAWGNGVPSAVAGVRTFVPPVLPAGVPPAAEVPSITLPNAAALAATPWDSPTGMPPAY